MIIQRPAIHVPPGKQAKPLWPYHLNRDSSQYNGLVAWWPMAPFVNAIDMGPSRRYTLANNSVSFVSSQERRLLVPNHTGSEYFTGSVVPLTAVPCSITCWINFPSSIDFSRAPIALCDSSGTGGMLWLYTWESAGNLTFYASMVYSGGTNRSDTIVKSVASYADSWHFFGGSFQSVNERWVYLDDENGGGDTTAGSAPAGIDTALIGARNFGGVAFQWKGMIDDVRIYNRALTTEDMLHLYLDPFDLYYEVGRKSYFFVETEVAAYFADACVVPISYEL